MATPFQYNKFVIGKNYEAAIFWRPGQPVFIKPYWVARLGDEEACMPKWGNATKQRHELMNEMRAFWVNKWYDKTIPEIKHWLLKAKPVLPEVIIEGLPEYFEYPHQVKTL